MRLALAAACCASLLGASPAHAQPKAKGKATLLSINDIYQIEGVDDRHTGGMSRVRALRAELEKTAPDLLFLHAGDFLSPSFPGRMFAGAQMVDVMNLMDGNPAAGSFDSRMFVAFGNHEFDDTNCNKPGPLARLVGASEFTWLASNLAFDKCPNVSGLAGSPRIAANRIVDSGGLKIGLFAVTLAYPEYAAIVRDPLAAACEQVAELRGKGADVVVALTHLSWSTDRLLLGFDEQWQPLPAAARPCAHAPDLVIGGHDHKSMALPTPAPRLFKADADAASAWVIEIEKGRAGLRIQPRLVELDRKRATDPLVDRVVDYWLRLHDERFCLRSCVGLAEARVERCLKEVEHGACLQERFVKAMSLIETEEIRNRSFETGFGDWVADQMRTAGKADVAFLNAGSIRINQDLPAGTVLTRRHLEQMFPFKNRLVLREVAGRELWGAMKVALGKRGEGAWAHFSGLAVQVAPAGDPGLVSRILVRRWNGEVVEIGPESTDKFSIASIGFVLSNGDGHGFSFCAGAVNRQKCMQDLEARTGWPLAGEGADLAGLVRLRMRELDAGGGLVVATDGRLCDRDQTGPCLINQWQPRRPRAP